jgi:GT2 family glycosyltransferase
MKVSLAIVSCNPELYKDAASHALTRAGGPVSLYGLGNGVDLGMLNIQDDHWVSELDENKGVPAALHDLWHIIKCLGHPADDEIVVYIHDDVRILEQDWDLRVARAFDDPKVGLAGFGGSEGIGAADIYKAPYSKSQLGRTDFFSNMTNAEIHGQRVTTERPIVYTDGFSMIVRRSLLDKIEGWSWWPFELVHHAYDYGIACMARRHGYTARLVPCYVEHRNGMTGSTAMYQEFIANYGGDLAVHERSHRFVYDTFSDVLPLRLP